MEVAPIRLYGSADSSGMDAEFQRRLANLFASAPEEYRTHLGIYSGFRDQAKQDRLFSQAVKKYGSEAAARKWVAKKSEHTAGFAADVGWDGAGLKGAPKAAIKWLHDNAGNYGLHFPLSNENWHIEPIEVRASGKPVYDVALKTYPGLQPIAGHPVPPADIQTADAGIDRAFPRPMPPSIASAFADDSVPARVVPASLPSFRHPVINPDPQQMFADGSHMTADQVAELYANMPMSRLPSGQAPGLTRMPSGAQFGVDDPGDAPAMTGVNIAAKPTVINGHPTIGRSMLDPSLYLPKGRVDPVGSGPKRNSLAVMLGLDDTAASTYGQPPITQAETMAEQRPGRRTSLGDLLGAADLVKPGSPTTGFNTVLPPAMERQYQSWKRQTAPDDSGSDYDFRGAFAAGVEPTSTGHWPDTFKKPSEPTFSNESQYAKYAPQMAGKWDGDTYVPRAASLEARDERAAASRPKPSNALSAVLDLGNDTGADADWNVFNSTFGAPGVVKTAGGQAGNVALPRGVRPNIPDMGSDSDLELLGNDAPTRSPVPPIPRSQPARLVADAAVMPAPAPTFLRSVAPVPHDRPLKAVVAPTPMASLRHPVIAPETDIADDDAADYAVPSYARAAYSPPPEKPNFFQAAWRNTPLGALLDQPSLMELPVLPAHADNPLARLLGVTPVGRLVSMLQGNTSLVGPVLGRNGGGGNSASSGTIYDNPQKYGATQEDRNANAAARQQFLERWNSG